MGRRLPNNAPRVGNMSMSLFHYAKWKMTKYVQLGTLNIGNVKGIMPVILGKVGRMDDHLPIFVAMTRFKSIFESMRAYFYTQSYIIINVLTLIYIGIIMRITKKRHCYG